MQERPRIAIAHDYLNQYGGQERELEAIAEIWPEAQIYTSIFDKKLMEPWLKIDPKRIHTNFIQKLPFPFYFSKHYVFLYPLAFKYQDIGEVDIVISISTYASKFVRKSKNAIHIGYINTPPRFLYGYDRELTGYRHRKFDKYLEPLYGFIAPPLLKRLKKADQDAVADIDFLISNSNEIKKRVKESYGRDSEVIYPPVDTKKFLNKEVRNGDFYLVVSRLGGYKKVDIVVEAFNKIGKRLKVIGVGPQLERLKAMARGNIEFLGRASDEEVVLEMLSCKGLVFPTYEDFGIVPVEAQAAGKAVIAFAKGGALETVVEGKTGIFFHEQTPEAIIEAVKKFENTSFSPNECIKQAEKFSKEKFQQIFREFVYECYNSKLNNGK